MKVLHEFVAAVLRGQVAIMQDKFKKAHAEGNQIKKFKANYWMSWWKRRTTNYVKKHGLEA